MVRSESDKLSKAPIKVQLGEAEYEIKPLPILKARTWRNKFVEVMTEATASFASSATADGVAKALSGALDEFPEKLTELVFDYAGNLPTEKILEEATEEQMVEAWKGICLLAFPFLGQLKTVDAIVRKN